MSAFKIALFAAVLAVVACDHPSYGKAYRPTYKAAHYSPAPSYAPAVYEPVYAASTYKPAYKPAPYNKGYGNDYYDDKAEYVFDWAVRDDYTGNHYGHTEQRDGYKTSGEYRTLLPDGRYQIVTYIADDYGYRADVHYEGEAKYDTYKPAPSYLKPVYAPYKPSYSSY